MKIFHILTSQAWGGLELYVLSLVKKLQEEGHEIALYCLENSRVDKEAKKCGLPVYYAYKQARISLKDLLKVKKIIQQKKFEVIHTHTRLDVWLGSLVKRFLEIRLIHSLYMSAPAKKDILHKFIYANVDAITSSSEILNQRIEKNYPIPAHKIHLLRYGREKNEFEKNKEERLLTRKILNSKENSLVFGAMCRIDTGKGVRELAESILYLSPEIKKQIKIWIMGEPTLAYTNKLGQAVYEEQSLELYNWLKEFVKKNEDCIEIIPFQKNIRPYLEAMDVFILATYKETYSLSVLDAMSSSLPIIGTNSGGTREQVKHLERGYLIEPKDAKSIATAITYYAQHQELIAKHGQAAKEWVKNQHDWKKAISELEQLYKKV